MKLLATLFISLAHFWTWSRFIEDTLQQNNTELFVSTPHYQFSTVFPSAAVPVYPLIHQSTVCLYRMLVRTSVLKF